MRSARTGGIGEGGDVRANRQQGEDLIADHATAPVAIDNRQAESGYRTDAMVVASDLQGLLGALRWGRC